MAFRKSFDLLKCCSRLTRISTSLTRLTCQPLERGVNQCTVAAFIKPYHSPTLDNVPQRSFHILRQLTPEVTGQLFSTLKPTVTLESKRTLIKYGYKGRRKTVRSLLKRCYRLYWGGWIRPRMGRYNKVWRKGALQVARSRQHVFCGTGHSYMFDKMITKFWYKRKYYVDDPYENYELRPNFSITKRRGK